MEDMRVFWVTANCIKAQNKIILITAIKVEVIIKLTRYTPRKALGGRE
jgi:hypothetical protein